MKTKRVKIFVLCILLFFFLSGFSFAQTPKKGGVLKAIRASFPRCLGYPPDMVPIDSIFALLYAERLISWGTWEEKGKFVPILAESWKIDEKNKTITVHLRKGVKFHDGTPFNAEALKWNYDIRLEYKRIPDQEFIKSIDIIDEYTIRLNLSELLSTSLLNYLWSIQVFSGDAVKKYGKEWARTNAYGTGPFKLVEFQRDTLVRYEKNENYWRKGYPLLDGMEVRFIPDSVTASMMMEKKDADAWLDVGDVKQILALEEKGFKVNWGPGMMWALLPDSLDPKSPLSNKKVREAIEYAIDKSAIAKAVGFGKYEPLTQLVPSFHPNYVPGFNLRPYNPQKAKELLKEAGYPNGFDLNLLALNLPTPQDTATAIKSYLEAVGIRVTIDVCEMSRYNAALFTPEGWKGLALAASGINPDGTDIFAHFGPRPITYRFAKFQKSKEYLDLCEKAYRALNPKEMHKILQQANKKAMEDAMIIPLYRSAQAVVMQPYVYTDYIKIHSVIWDTAYKDWMDKK